MSVVSPVPQRTQTIETPNLRTPSQPCASKVSGSTTPFEIVLATSEPNVIAPSTSAISPSTIAWRSVSAFAPTEVPTELAMSLAPLAMATRAEAYVPTTLSRLSRVGCTTTTATMQPTTTRPTTSMPK